jgi:hypothetical protein
MEEMIHFLSNRQEHYLFIKKKENPNTIHMRVCLDYGENMPNHPV